MSDRAKQRRIVAATVRYQRACDAVSVRETADYALRDAKIEAARPLLSAMSTADLRELIADLARAHGCECAKASRVTAYSWGPFRAALAELARRAGT